MSTKLSRSNWQAITVCVVEDDDLFRGELERWLSKNEEIRCVDSFRDAEAALPKILRNKPDVLILDYGLPGMSGGELIRRLKETEPTIRILVITGIPDDSVVFDSLIAGADGFLDKQDGRYPRDELLREIGEVYAGNVPLSARALKLLLRELQKVKPNSFIWDLLSEREKELLPFLQQGLSDKEIAQKLHVEECTIKTHLHHTYEKLHVHNRTEAVAKLWGIK